MKKIAAKGQLWGADVFVLVGGTPVIAESGIGVVLGMSRDDLSAERYAPIWKDHPRIEFKAGGKKMVGRDARILVDISTSIIGTVDNDLPPSMQSIPVQRALSVMTKALNRAAEDIFEATRNQAAN